MKKKTKVMIVDDDRRFLEELKETLTLSGYESVVINDSTTTVNIARKTRPDCILLDLKMNKMDGFQVIEELKKLPETDRIPIIAMTGYFTRPEYSTLIGMCGVETCLMKPFNPLDAISRIEMVLSEN